MKIAFLFGTMQRGGAERVGVPHRDGAGGGGEPHLFAPLHAPFEHAGGYPSHFHALPAHSFCGSAHRNGLQPAGCS